MIESTLEPCLSFTPGGGDAEICECGWLAAEHLGDESVHADAGPPCGRASDRPAA